MRRLALILAMAGAALLLAGCEPLSTDELDHEVFLIHSTAAEGALLAQGVADSRTMSSFVRAHATELGDAADTSARKLHDATVPDALKARAAAAIGLAGQTSSALGDLELDPSGPGYARDIERRLERLARRATRLEDRL